MLNEYVLQIFSKITLHDCLVNCILSPPCEAINIHMDGATCETLRSSTLITKDILIGAPGWTFYEIDPAKRDVSGFLCFVREFAVAFSDLTSVRRSQVKIRTF